MAAEGSDLCGSQGAHAINVAMVRQRRGWQHATRLEITHQTGERDLELVRDGYRRAGLAATRRAVLFDMAREMKLADLVVCVGRHDIAELTASARAAISFAADRRDDHQRVNAEVLVKAGAAQMIEQRELTGERLAERIATVVRTTRRGARCRGGTSARASRCRDRNRRARPRARRRAA